MVIQSRIDIDTNSDTNDCLSLSFNATTISDPISDLFLLNSVNDFFFLLIYLLSLIYNLIKDGKQRLQSI